MTKKIIVKQKFTYDEMLQKEGEFFDENCCKIYKNDVDVYTDDGKLLLKFRKNILLDTDCKLLLSRTKKVFGSKRPSAAGYDKSVGKYVDKISKSTGKRVTESAATKKIQSGIIGYYDSVSNFGYHNNPELRKSKIKCRTTAYTTRNMDSFKECLPVFKKIDRIYKKLIPEYYEIQKKAIEKINPDFVIKDTIFTTVTVNTNFRTALHCDSGDFKEGFGNLVVVSDNDEYESGYTMFPRYGVGIDCRNGDFLAMNVHEFHCNSEKKGKGDRVSFVFYLREKMLKTCPKRNRLATSPKVHKKITGFEYNDNDCLLEEEIDGIKLVRCVVCDVLLQSRCPRDNSILYRNLQNHLQTRKHLNVFVKK